ncbi:unnamed protein product [Ilex paraguariensis]|uniref:Uncharacterized protein n=1 Tax=Ilex paraguariensis TaxID=185542 RepID=A0ABC8USY6_9AQUA
MGYHRDLLEHWAPPPPLPGGAIAILHPPPPPPPFIVETPNKTSPSIPIESIGSTPIKKIPTKRGKDRKSRSRRHRKVAVGSTDIS